jgi:hypothetical protein
MSIALPEDNESIPRNARSKISDAPLSAKVDASSSVQTVKRFKVILEEDSAIPPTGLFISANGKPYLLMAGIEAQVPQEVISVLNDAVISVPVIDPQSQRVTGYRSRLRFPYRRVDG